MNAHNLVKTHVVRYKAIKLVIGILHLKHVYERDANNYIHKNLVFKISWSVIGMEIYVNNLLLVRN